MKDLVTPFKVGLLVIAAAVAFAWMFGRASNSVFKRGDGYELHAYLNDATGLAEQSRVMMAGIAVGEVKTIRLDGNRARIVLRMQDDVELFEGIRSTGPSGAAVWLDGAALSKKQASLLGDYYIEVSPGLRGERLGNGDEIHNVVTPVGPATLFEQMSALATNLQGISRDVQQVSSNLAAVFGDPETADRLQQIIGDMQNMVATLENVTATNQDALTNIVGNVEAISGEMRQFTGSATRNVDGILADVQGMTTELRYIMGRSSEDVAQGIGTLTGTLSSLQLALDTLNYSLANVQEITDRVADGEGTIGRLVNDDTLATEAERVLSGTGDLIEGINRVQTWVELRSEYGLNEHAFKSYVTLSLRPNPDKFYTLELVDDPRGDTETTQIVTISSDPDEPPSQFQEQSITRQRFKFSVLIGQRWPILDEGRLYIGGRFGIMESSGGIGANIWAFQDNLELRVDLFDFGASRRARLRTYAVLRGGLIFNDSSVLSNVFLHAGFDDLLNPGPRDVFLGGGIQFNDQDIRSLIGTVGTSALR